MGLHLSRVKKENRTRNVLHGVVLLLILLFVCKQKEKEREQCRCSYRHKSNKKNYVHGKLHIYVTTRVVMLQVEKSVTVKVMVSMLKQ